jgi:hypothetical protein
MFRVDRCSEACLPIPQTSAGRPRALRFSRICVR